MATEVEFLDPLRVRVETINGDVYIIGYTDNTNYQIEQQCDHFYTKCVSSIFDKYYDGNEKTIWGPILAEMYRWRIYPFMWVMMDKDKERARIGSRIVEIRKEKKMDAKELAQIAITTAETARSLAGIDPKVAMLSFSTKGSAKHELIDKVTAATRLAKEMAPELDIDGELQADAALIPTVAEKKAPGSAVAGNPCRRRACSASP